MVGNFAEVTVLPEIPAALIRKRELELLSQFSSHEGQVKKDPKSPSKKCIIGGNYAERD